MAAWRQDPPSPVRLTSGSATLDLFLLPRSCSTLSSPSNLKSPHVLVSHRLHEFCPRSATDLQCSGYDNCYSGWDTWGRWVAFAVIVGCAFLVFFSFA